MGVSAWAVETTQISSAAKTRRARRSRYPAERSELFPDADIETGLLLGGIVGNQEFDKLGLGGCLATIIAAATLLIPATRDYWVWAMVTLAIGWLPFLTLQRLPRYRRIEKLVSEHEASLPHYVILLQAVEHPEGLSGGHITTN